MEHVFVTGATGFVGQRLLGALAQEVDGDSSHAGFGFLRVYHTLITSRWFVIYSLTMCLMMP